MSYLYIQGLLFDYTVIPLICEINHYQETDKIRLLNSEFIQVIQDSFIY